MKDRDILLGAVLLGGVYLASKAKIPTISDFLPKIEIPPIPSIPPLKYYDVGVPQYIPQAVASDVAGKANSAIEDVSGLSTITNNLGLVLTSRDDPRAIYQDINGAVWRNP